MARDYNMTHEALEFTTNVYGCTTRTNQQRVRQPTSSRQPWLRSRHRSLSDSPTRTSIGISQQPFATSSRKVTGPSAPPKPRLQPSNQPFRWAGAWRFAYEIAFMNMDFFVDQDASIFNLPEDAPWGIWVSLTLGGRISELVNG